MKKFFLVSASVFALGMGNAMAASSIINDAGDNNVNTVDQSGQIWGGPASAGSSSEIVQSVGSKGGSVEVRQEVGYSNSQSIIEQVQTDAARAKVRQVGRGGFSDSKILQGANGLFVEQVSAEVFQSSTGGVNNVDVRQGTQSNSSNVTAVLMQSGGNSNANVTQDGQVVFTVGRQYGSNDLSVVQEGNRLRSENWQVGTGNDAIVVQNGERLLSKISQDKGDYNLAITLQGGHDNTASSTQHSANSNFSGILQDGHDNTASVTQQSADSNISNILQASSGNSANVTQQFTNGSQSWIAQLGENNIANVTQQSANGSESWISQLGDNNTANVTQQFANGNYSFISQTGNGGISTVTQ